MRKYSWILRGAALIFICLILYLVYCFIKTPVSIKLEGMMRFVHNTKDYNYFIENINNDFSVDIDIFNLESNKGKVLYDDGICKIIVSWFDKQSGQINDGYRIGFKAIGEYNYHQAVLISGLSYEVLDTGIVTSFDASAAAYCENKIFVCNIYGYGPKDKDGDSFSFYITPVETDETVGVFENQPRTIKVVVSNLVKNVWGRK